MSKITPGEISATRRVTRVEVILYINGQTTSQYRQVEDFIVSSNGVAQFVNISPDGKAELITTSLPFKVIAHLEEA